VIICVLSTIFSSSLAFTTTMMFVLGLSASGVATVAFVYMLECMPPEWRSTAGSWANIVAFSLPVLYAAYFRFIVQDYIYLMWIAIINVVVPTLALFFYLEESPEYLLKSG
jgi:hypothetical protein